MRSFKAFCLVIVFATILYGGFALGQNYKGLEYSDLCEQGVLTSQLENSQIVYVCTGAYAYAYHSRSDCPGLGNCKGEVKYCNEDYATNNLARVPCCRCWSNVYGRCKDDNPNYVGSSGGGASEDYGYVVLAVMVTSAVILSNDIYVYPTYSFYKNYDEYDLYSGLSTISDGNGWTLGFRKTFKHSAIEYGTSYLSSIHEFNYGGGHLISKEVERWGWHFNYVHHLFYNRTTDRLKLYLGPSVNHVSGFGYGGVMGSEIRLLDRLKLDMRYEYTTQTNQVQAGLIFTYQKKYFWQKR